MPLASASFQPAGEEELELLLAPGTVTGFKGVQQVQSGCYQAKLRNGRSFMSFCKVECLDRRPMRRVMSKRFNDRLIVA